MKKWAHQIEAQRRRYGSSRARQSGGTSANEFIYMQNQGALENPYVQQGEDDEDDDLDTLVAGDAPSWYGVGYSQGDFSQSRNGSSSSLRSRSTTGDGASQAGQGLAMLSRAGPPRFNSREFQQAQQPQPLTLRTQQFQQQMASPGERGGESYFSPSGDSPLSSSRTSSSSGMYPFPRQAVPPNGYYEDGHAHTRYTAPAIARNREPSQTSNGYAPPGRGVHPRPSFPAGSGLHSAQQMPPPRNRSASSPDIHNGQPGRGNSSAYRNGSGQPPVPDVPVSYQQNPHMIPRSLSNSPNLTNGPLPPPRGPNQSPQLQRERAFQNRAQQDPSPTTGYRYDGRPDPRDMQYPSSRNVTPAPGRGTGTFSPPPPPQTAIPPTPTTATGGIIPDIAPTQLKVKVQCPSASQTLTLVVPLNISYESLRDRIDAKLQRSTNLSLGDRGSKESQVKLKYLDEDDYVSIQSDEDVQTAFETWREQRGEGTEGMGEIELFCQR